MSENHKGTVLVVGDKAANLVALLAALRQAGYLTLVAEDTMAALAIVAQALPDIVLLAVKLTDMEGFELYARLGDSERAPEPPPFPAMASGIEGRLRAFDLQVVDYITKPFQPQELVARVDRHLLLHNLRRRLREQNTQLQREITDRKQAEVALAEKSAYLDSILRSADDRAIITTDLELRITYFNPQAEVFYCLPATEALGKHIQDVCTETQPADRVAQGLAAARAQGEHHYVMALHIGGGTRYLASRISGIYNARGALIGYARFSQDITARMRAEEELKQYRDHLEELVAERTQRMRDLTARLADAEQTERRQLARELHDSVTQSLHSLALFSETITDLLEKGRYERAKQVVARLQESARETLKEMRLLLYNLQSGAWAGDHPDLLRSLEERLQSVEQRAGIRTQLALTGPPAWPQAWNRDLFHIAAEALNNALKHAQATQVEVAIRCDHESGRLTLAVTDNGRGFAAAATRPGGMGLQTMAARAADLGGAITVDSTLGGGTRVTFVGAYQP